LKRYTPRSIVEPKRLLKEVKEARTRGCAIDDEEYLAGVRAVAAVIQMPSLLLAAIWVVGFTSSLNDTKMERVVSEIRKAAQEISRAMGHSSGRESPSRR
jgi:DNA-binding IclR family transcriptional regulator